MYGCRAIIGSVSEVPETVYKALPVRWAGVESVPVLMANQFLVQVDAVADRPDQLILAIGQHGRVDKRVIDRPEHLSGKIQEFSEVTVRTLARFSITPARLGEFSELLRRALGAFDGGATGGEAGS